MTCHIFTFTLTVRKGWSTALRVAGDADVLLVRAVMMEPLTPSTQQQTRLFSCAAHIVKMNGA